MGLKCSHTFLQPLNSMRISYAVPAGLAVFVMRRLLVTELKVVRRRTVAAATLHTTDAVYND